MYQALYLNVSTTNANNFCKPVLSKLQEFHCFQFIESVLYYRKVFNRRRMQDIFLR